MNDQLPDGIVYIPDVDPGHVCKPPAIETFGPRTDPKHPPTRVQRLREGTIFVCPQCGQGMVLRWKAIYDDSYWPGYYVWCDEPRRERRKRLGLRWWQRERRRP